MCIWKYLIAILIGLQTMQVIAQQPAKKLDQWGLQNPIEKIYLHLDREDYLSGQTIWFKAYCYSAYNANTDITTIYTELVSPYSGVISRKSFPVARGISQGQFELPDSLTSGYYVIRSYSATMLNQDAAFVSKRRVFISGKKNTTVYTNAEKKILLDFFPEGGNFIVGRSNTIAFKATDEKGLPVNVSGQLYNAKGNTLTSFTSYHDGMGMLEIDTADREGYYVVLDNNPDAKKYLLPLPVTEGVVFRLLSMDDGIHFEIEQQKNDPVFNVSYMIGQLQHEVVFIQPFKEGSGMMKGVIKTANLSSGILHITLFNKNGMPLGERLSFINNREYIQKGKLLLDTVNFLPRGRNRFTLTLEDTVIGSISIAVTDPAFDMNRYRTENIYSSILLSSDLRGYIHNPAYYFSPDNDSAKYALDLVMMTNGWRRFNWKQVMADSLLPSRYKDPAFVTVSGRVTLEGTRKPFADKDLMIYIAMADSSRTMNLIHTDANGEYRADSLLFFGNASILLSDIRGKKSRFVDIKPGPDSLNRFYPIPAISRPYLLGMQDFSFDTQLQKKLDDEYDAIRNASGQVLSEVVLKSKKKTPLEVLEEKYASGAFAGDSRRTFDLLNNDEASTYMNVFDFLRSRVPGLQTGKTEDGDYYAYYRQSPTISSLGNQQMDIFLDEVPTDANTIAFINPNQIALVKVYSQFIGSAGGGGGGAIAVYMKKGEDLFTTLPSAGEVIRYGGYAVIREFYSPDYSMPVRDKTEPDKRITLQWMPDVFVSTVNPKIPIRFFNNDRTGSFKVVIEGMTLNGKMLLIEKTIAGKPF